MGALITLAVAASDLLTALLHLKKSLLLKFGFQLGIGSVVATLQLRSQRVQSVLVKAVLLTELERHSGWVLALKYLNALLLARSWVNVHIKGHQRLLQQLRRPLRHRYVVR